MPEEGKRHDRDHFFIRLFPAKVSTLESLLKCSENFLYGAAVVGVLTMNPLISEGAEAQEPKTEVKNEDKGGFYKFLSASILHFTLNTNTFARVSTVPEVVRFVPNHKDDSSANEGPIEDPSLDYGSWSFVWDLNAGLGYRTGSIDVRIGGNLDIMVVDKGEDNRNSRNYTNAVGTENRGFGAALTYYAFSKGSFLDIFGHAYGGFSRIGYSFWRNRANLSQTRGAIFVEYDLDFSNLSLENGWDRFDSLDTNRVFKLAGLTSHTFKLGLEVQESGFGGELYVGYTLPRTRLTQLGRASSLETENFWVLGYVVDWKGKF